MSFIFIVLLVVVFSIVCLIIYLSGKIGGIIGVKLFDKFNGKFIKRKMILNELDK